jgi:transcriptional regulator with XRE-family HTH domain
MLDRVDDARLGRLVRALRHRRRWRQVDLAARAGVGHDAITKLESGRLGPMRTESIRAIVAAFGLSYEPSIRGLGGQEDRLLDQRHADLLGSCAEWLGHLRWVTRAEVSYSEWGERGSIDLLAWHSPSASLLVIEIKSELVSVESTLRKLDEKARLAAAIVRPFGWRPVSVSRLLVLPDDRTQRRRVAAQARILSGAFPTRSHELRRWCREPSGAIAGLLFLADPAGRTQSTGVGRRERVRPAPRAHHNSET